MKLPKNYFANLTVGKYREYLKLLPVTQQDNAKIITAIIFTFLAMSFFGIFAINPTLSTIVTLKKQLADSRAVHEKLGIKIKNLSSLQQQYNTLTPDLPVVFDAMPQDPKAPILMGQLIALSQKTKVQLNSFQISEIEQGNKKKVASASSYLFFIQAQGSYDDLINFSKSVATLNRIVGIDSMTLTKDIKANSLVLSLGGRGYFKE